MSPGGGNGDGRASQRATSTVSDSAQVDGDPGKAVAKWFWVTLRNEKGGLSPGPPTR